MADEIPATGKCVVVADDESDILVLVRTTLESAGHEVHSATNGADALELVRETKPDLVILDIMMPQLSGLDALREIRADDEICHIPCIMLTGLSQRDKVQEALDAGAEYYIVKPFEYNDLLSKVNMAMQEPEGL